MSWNVGHRGAAGLEPENTLRSFLRAFEEGADALELDLRVTRDGHLVVLHDHTVDRTTNGTGPVFEMTLEELQKLDAGLGERVPTFYEVVEATVLPLYAELKVVEAARVLAELLQDDSIAGRVIPISFHREILSEVKAVLPDFPMGLVLSGASLDADERAHGVGATLVSLEASHLRPEVVERCQRAGLRTTTWTVNDPEEMQWALDLSLDGVVTDRPDLLTRLTKRERRRSS
jgi:glycerophosphoryl diester phosphodiesterase